ADRARSSVTDDLEWYVERPDVIGCADQQREALDARLAALVRSECDFIRIAPWDRSSDVDLDEIDIPLHDQFAAKQRARRCLIDRVTRSEHAYTALVVKQPCGRLYRRDFDEVAPCPEHALTGRQVSCPEITLVERELLRDRHKIGTSLDMLVL